MYYIYDTETKSILQKDPDLISIYRYRFETLLPKLLKDNTHDEYLNQRYVILNYQFDTDNPKDLKDLLIHEVKMDYLPNYKYSINPDNQYLYDSYNHKLGQGLN